RGGGRAGAGSRGRAARCRDRFRGIACVRVERRSARREPACRRARTRPRLMLAAAFVLAACFAAFHFQATVATQAHPAFDAPYSGRNSLQPTAESATSVVMDLSAEISPWAGAQLTLAPELAGGRGLSSTLGVAAFPSGEVYRVGNPEPSVILARLSVKQSLAPVTISAGKLAVTDFFD